MNKPVYLALSILELSKIVMHAFWYDFVKLKYGEKTKMCVHELVPFFNSPRGTNHNMDF